MSDYFTYYILTEEEKENISKTYEILKSLEKNDALNSRFHFSLIREMLKSIVSNSDIKMRI